MSKKPLVVLVFVLIGVLLIGGYHFHWNWTGFSNKTLWDWFQLLGVLAIPVVVGWFTLNQSRLSDNANMKQRETELQITTDNQRESALQGYIDSMSKLLLNEHLGELTADGGLKPEYEQVRKIARVRTITVLTQLDARRVGYVFAFLREAGLMSKQLNNSIINLIGADLSKINLSRAYLGEANFGGADLSEANLSEANLVRTSFYHANLFHADLSGSILAGANLSGTILSAANLHGALQLHLLPHQ
jgi:uncharacterized protein YjbI with pentapeptide repeats